MFMHSCELCQEACSLVQKMVLVACPKLRRGGLELKEGLMDLEEGTRFQREPNVKLVPHAYA